MARYNYLKYRMHKLFSIHQIVTIHYLTHIHDVTTPIGRHDFWEMVFVDVGQAEVLAGERWQTLGADQIFLHPPKQLHAVRIGQATSTVFILSFVCSSVNMGLIPQRAMKLSHGQKKVLSLLIGEASRAFELNEKQLMLQNIEANPRAPIGGEQLVCNHLEELLISLLREAAGQTDTSTIILGSKDEMENRIVADLKSYISEHLGEPLSVEGLSRMVRYSRAHLSNIFKASTGMGLMEYVGYARIERAKEMLSEGGRSVTQIADALGYTSVHYFSRKFKQLVGYSPTQYARTIECNLLEIERGDKH